MQSKSNFRANVKRFFGPVKYAQKYYAINIPLRIYESVLLVMSMNMLKLITEYISAGNTEGITTFIIIYAALICGYFVLYVLFRDYENLVFIVPNYHIFRDNLKMVLSMENTYYERIGTGRLIEISRGAITWSSLISEVLGKGINLSFTLVLSFLTITLIDWRYTILLFLSIILVLLIYRYIYPKTKKLLKERKEIWSEASRFTVKFFMSKNEILTQSKSAEEFTHLFRFLEREEQNIHQRNNYNIRVFKFPDFLVYALQVSIVLIFGFGAIKGTNTIGDFAMFLGLLMVIQKSLFDLLGLIRKLDFELVHVHKIRETFDNAPMIKHNVGKPFLYKQGNISMQHITFAYNKEPILQKFSLDLKGGTKTAFVGESGGGKSTLVKLLAAHVQAQEGDILIDGQALSKTKLTDYYKHIGYLTQDPSVFDGTIYENLCYGVATKTVSEAQLKKVIKLAKCDFVREFEEGLATEIGERGVRLSGGQKQRLAIAKIMLKDPNIIFLDEPTSALDSFNEEQISIALHNLFKGRTVIVIAHRLQTVKEADRILFIEKGQIVEDGTHETLIAQNGKYKKMLDLQSGF